MFFTFYHIDAQVEKAESSIAFFDCAEATFPEGNDALLYFVNNHIQYPETAILYGEKGVVVVECIVEPDGSFSSIRVLKSDSVNLEEEVVRIVKLMPKWIPPETNGKAIRSRAIIRVNFQLI